MTEIRKATAQDAGCWVEGSWGQYGLARMVSLAAQVGYDEDPGLISIADRHLASMGPSNATPITDDEFDILADSQDVEDWLNAHVAPEGYSFGWHDGEFFLWSDTSWADA